MAPFGRQGLTFGAYSMDRALWNWYDVVSNHDMPCDARDRRKP
ncbi:hypothetical protein Sinac_2739 [Singulisphaera acidiphila DSM 18658]|uniref:Uncharacterized protein n=1 Tax=Singulisphaera acidiphila (strain ATCC BAA-1392 / DSM 18658 / VKM B-2454 / MOB10) TaxID=886293 RepID=L0DDU3_SINAD|nr:hypothetical protein Sinac_2739 [Singulisphaera acidiphila DSM 18658]